jgi:hypothetical protein
LRDPLKSSYACRHGLNHLVECRRYGQAVELLDYLVRNEEKFESGQRPDLDQFAKLITSALGGPCPPTESEAKQVEPHKLARLIQGLYMTDPLYGGIRLIVEHHPVEWPEILEDLLATDDYVLRHTISEVLADSYAELGKPSQLEEILKLAEHPDINHRELGSYALGLVYAEDPTCIEPKYLNLLAEGETYPFRSVLGDLLLSLALQDKDNDSSKGVEMIKSVAPSSHFWNPLWDFNRMDVDWLKAVDGFVRNQQPSAESPDSVRRAYDSLVKTEKRRQDLLQGGQLAEAVASSLKSYYQLGVKEKEIRKAQSELKSGAALAAWCEVLFAHPLWEVTESAASVLASIVDEKPDAAQVISELFDHDLWRVQFGAAFLPPSRAAAARQLRGEFDRLDSGQSPRGTEGSARRIPAAGLLLDSEQPRRLLGPRSRLSVVPRTAGGWAAAGERVAVVRDSLTPAGRGAEVVPARPTVLPAPYRGTQALTGRGNVKAWVASSKARLRECELRLRLPPAGPELRRRCGSPKPHLRAVT